MIFYVPPHGLLATLEDMVAVLGPARLCCVTRELTKMHETFHRATLQDTLQHFNTTGVRGEIALLVRGSSDEDMLLGALPTVRTYKRATCCVLCVILAHGVDRPAVPHAGDFRGQDTRAVERREQRVSGGQDGGDRVLLEKKGCVCQGSGIAVGIKGC